MHKVAGLQTIACILLGISAVSAINWNFGSGLNIPGLGNVGGSASGTGSSGNASVGGSTSGSSLIPGLTNPFGQTFPSILPNLTNPLGSIPNLSNLVNSSRIPTLPILFNIPSLSSLPSIPNLSSIVQIIRNLRFPFMPSIGEIADDLQNLNSTLANFLNTGQDIQNAIGAVENAVTSAVKAGTSQVTNAVQNSIKSAQQMGKNFQNAIANAQNEFQKVVNQQTSAAQRCIGGQIFDGFSAAQNTVQGCVENQINKAIALGTKVGAQIGNATANVAHVSDSLRQCASVSTQFSLSNMPNITGPTASCVASSLLQIQVQTLLLPINLAQDAAQATAQINGLQGAFVQCTGDVMGAVANATVVGFATIAKCMLSSG